MARIAVMDAGLGRVTHEMRSKGTESIEENTFSKPQALSV